MTDEPPGAAAIAAAVRAGDRSAEEVILDTFCRIDSRESELHAFLHLQRDGALARARQIDSQVAAGEDPGPLAGVPVAVKDNICTAGIPTTAGSRILEGYIPTHDATAVERVLAAGGIIVGKTNLDEFAMGSSSEHSAYGPTRNPWDLGRVPGGSSGGSAAAIASGMVPLALGTDTGGSIRQPAALCGAVGLKPTYGRVSRYGLIAFASSLDQIGPLGRSVEDVALLLDAMAGPDPRDSTASREPPGTSVPPPPDRLDGVKLGLPAEYLRGADPGVAARIHQVVGILERGGAEVREVPLPLTPYGIACYYILCTAEASSNLGRYDGVQFGPREGGGLSEGVALTRETRFGPEVKLRILLGTFVLSEGYYDAYYLKAARVRTQIRREFEEAFRSVDGLIGPTSPVTAFPLGEKVGDPLQMYLCDVLTVTANLAGLPAVSVPCGLAQGLPVGFQITGKPFSEAHLIRLASYIEAEVPLPGPPPDGAGK